MESDMVFNVGKSSELEACTRFWLAGQFENFDCRLMIYPDSDPDPDSYRDYRDVRWIVDKRKRPSFLKTASFICVFIPISYFLFPS